MRRALGVSAFGLALALPALAAAAPDGGIVSSALRDLDGLTQSPEKLTPAFRIAILMTLLSLAPALVMMLTCFVRVVVVLSLLRQAIGVPQIPPNQVLIALALFLTLFAMQPTFETAYTSGVGPYLRGELDDQSAFGASVAPFRDYMLRQTRDADLFLFEEIARKPLPVHPDQLELSVLVPAYMLSELRTSFTIGFLLFLPFLVIDMVVASTLLAMGMIVVPPVVISLPIKLMIFVLVDGWTLVVGAIVRGIL